ncbi:hypothetical protein GCM10010124_25950 [Pilimelia terevasa]|uniref:Uncharacterized protein n=2 Tax=Pilimelia terevasa TaxID=53372 RepID=A0A8J3FIC0_9ACTN|nr:hypothetical protein GCM10010124_25950 [Pilimelia terevasa]
MTPTRPTIPAQRRGSDPLSGRTGHLHDMARRLIRDAIRHYPGARVACLDLNDHRLADVLLHLIRTAQLHITWPDQTS